MFQSKLFILITSLFIVVTVSFIYFNIKHLNKSFTVDIKKLYETIYKNDKVVLYFREETCYGCKILEPYLYEIIEKRKDIKFVIIDIGKLMEKDVEQTLIILQEFRVKGTPTLILFKEGREIGRQEGLFKGNITQELESFFKKL